MNQKTQKLIIIIVVILAIVLAGIGLYKYQTTNKGISLQTALIQRDAARAQAKLASQKYDNLKQVSDYNDTQNKAVVDKLTAVCGQLKAAKLTNPACQ